MTNAKQVKTGETIDETIALNTPTVTTVGAIATVRAKQRAISVDKAAKEVRGILRANFDVVTAIDPSIEDVKQSHNDGNRWPAMHADVERYVTDRAFRAECNAKHRKPSK